MKQSLILIALFLTWAQMLMAQSLHYGIDGAHSHIKFIGLLADMMEVEGRFDEFWGDVFFDPAHPEAVSISLAIDPASLDSDSEWRDKHLANPEFLHVDSFPIIRFQSSGPADIDQSLPGMLYLKGKEYPITIQYNKALGPVDDPWKNRRLTFSGSFEFSRSAYDLGPTEGFWGNGIADQARVEFSISVTRQNMDLMSVFRHEPMTSVWTTFQEKGMKAGLVALDAWKNNPPDEKRMLRARYVDQIAKRLRQYGQEYLDVLITNTKYFPDEAWVHANLALGYREVGQKQAMLTSAEKALELYGENTLARELLKEGRK
ncbi:MAG: YceI family protein [Bacteroidota bacterium]